MAEEPLSLNQQFANLAGRIETLEKKVLELENQKKSEIAGAQPGYLYDLQDEQNIDAKQQITNIENKIGEYGLAWFGNIVLFFGIILLKSFIADSGYNELSYIIGYIMAGGILVLSNVLKDNFSYISQLFSVFGQILIFYLTLTLHFFTKTPIITSLHTEILILYILLAAGAIFFIRKKSEGFTTLIFLFFLSAVIIANTTHLWFVTMTVWVAGILILYFKFGWWRIFLFSLFAVYLSFLIWLLGNPVISQHFELVKNHQGTIVYLLVIAYLFSIIALFRENEIISEHIIFIGLVLNCLFFSILLLFWVLSYYSVTYAPIFFVITFFNLFYSVVQKRFSDRKYTPSLFALYGFLSLSLAINGIIRVPEMYLLLCLQSIIVVVIALYFRSKIIILINTFLFLIIMVSYFSSDTQMIPVSFMFPVIAFSSARIINWQKTRLEIKTDFIRNTYLAALFFSLLYSLYLSLPHQYITFSWIIVAIIYFFISSFLNNVKYRWMAIGTMICAAIYLFFVDLSRFELIFRIIAIIILAIVSIFISIYYVKKLKTRNP